MGCYDEYGVSPVQTIDRLILGGKLINYLLSTVVAHALARVGFCLSPRGRAEANGNG